MIGSISTWRYLDSPRPYTALGAAGGYAIVGHKRLRGIPVAYVADIVGEATHALLRASLARRGPGPGRCSRSRLGTSARRT